jgi:cytochrome c oxidase subunit 3
VVSLVLGLGFVTLQYLGWMQMYSVGIDLKGNPAGSFIYVITGVHALHIIGGIAAMLVALINAFTLKFNVTEKRKINFELTLQYWHFVDLLWVYLLIFLYISRT